MSKKSFFFILILVLVIAGVFFVNKKESKAPTSETPIAAPATPAVITATDAGFSPVILTVDAGTTVTFKNEGPQPVWPASALHPTHTVYPTTGGCSGSTFDACKGLKTGESWSFQFDAVGRWGYHDHLRPNHTGLVVVQ